MLRMHRIKRDHLSGQIQWRLKRVDFWDLASRALHLTVREASSLLVEEGTHQMRLRSNRPASASDGLAVSADTLIQLRRPHEPTTELLVHPISLHPLRYPPNRPFRGASKRYVLGLRGAPSRLS